MYFSHCTHHKSLPSVVSMRDWRVASSHTSKVFMFIYGFPIPWPHPPLKNFQSSVQFFLVCAFMFGMYQYCWKLCIILCRGRMCSGYSWGIQKHLWHSTTCHYLYLSCQMDFHHFLCSVEQGHLWMICWKACGRKWAWTILRYYPCVCMERLRNTMKTLGQGINSSGSDFNMRPPEYEAGVSKILWKIHL